MILPDDIRSLRAALGMTQGQAARLVGVDGRTWRRWECAEREMPEPVCRLLRLTGRPGVRAALERMAGEAPGAWAPAEPDSD